MIVLNSNISQLQLDSYMVTLPEVPKSKTRTFHSFVELINNTCIIKTFLPPSANILYLFRVIMGFIHSSEYWRKNSEINCLHIFIVAMLK